MRASRTEFLIIGAGPTGLGAARQLVRLGIEDWLLVEQAAHPGGLASSFLDENGFTWDIGGHVQFSHYDYFDQAMDEFLGSDGWLHHEREAWIWMRDRFIPYPIQKNLHLLPDEELLRCLEGLVDCTRNPKVSIENFGDWIEAKFGSGIAEVFLTPYNRKVWAHDPPVLNAKWVGERVAVTDLMSVLRSLVKKEVNVSWGPNHQFRFPKRGGTGAIWRAAAEQLPSQQLRYGYAVERIDLDNKRVHFNHGQAIEYSHLISTLPLNQLVERTQQIQFSELAHRGLLSSSSHVFGIGIRGQAPPHLASKCWIYFPESNCPFYRVTVFSNYSPNNVPDSNHYWSLMAEVSESFWVPRCHEKLWSEVLDGLIATKLIDQDTAIASRWNYVAKLGYPVPGLHRDETLNTLIPFFEDRQVYSRGRFGLWKYEVSNQDHAFMQGVEVVERLVNGRVEMTANHPDFVNATKQAWPYAS